MKINTPEHDSLQHSVALALDYLENINTRPVAPSAMALANLNVFDEALPVTGKDINSTLSLLHDYGSPGTVASNGNRYYGFVIGGAQTAALGAHIISTAWDQNACLVPTSPVSACIESVVEQWLTEILPVAKNSVVGFVTGVTMANFCGLAAARSAILHRQGWDVEAKGLFGAPPINVVIGEEAHGSLLKALSMLGLGRERVLRIPSDNNGRIRADLIPPLDDQTILCLQAGNVNTGAMDDGAIIRDAKLHGAWVHIDGAFGLWAGASSSKKDLTLGYENADSWATDGHKWLNVPYDSGLIICADSQYLKRAMSMSGDYLDQSGDRVPYQYTPELSRRARAIDIWAALRTLGKSGIDDLITRTCAYAAFMAEELHKAGYDVLNLVETNQVLVSFGGKAHTEAIIKSIQHDGTCWCGGTVWRGRFAMRISFSSYKTTFEDVEKSLAAILKVASKRPVMYL